MKTCAYNIHKAKNVLGTMIQITYLKCEKKKILCLVCACFF